MIMNGAIINKIRTVEGRIDYDTSLSSPPLLFGYVDQDGNASFDQLMGLNTITVPVNSLIVFEPVYGRIPTFTGGIEVLYHNSNERSSVHCRVTGNFEATLLL